MRRGVWVVVLIASVLLVAGCSARTAPEPLRAPSDTGVVGTAGDTSQTVPATETPSAEAPNPAVLEGIPSSLGLQVTSADGETAVSQAQAMQIADKRKPAGATNVTAKHVLFAKSGDKEPVDAWMITFHDAQLPGAGGSGSSAKIGSITVFVDSSTGAIVEEIAYEPAAK
jgi:hypothetical protein